MIKFTFEYIEFEVLVRWAPCRDFQKAVEYNASRI